MSPDISNTLFIRWKDFFLALSDSFIHPQVVSVPTLLLYIIQRGTIGTLDYLVRFIQFLLWNLIDLYKMIPRVSR